MSDVFELFVESVNKKKQLHCSYQGRHRELCVHAVGWKNGKEQALAFQFAGESSKGLSPGGEWRCMALSQVTDVLLKDGSWHTQDNHSRPQTCVDKIAAEVVY
ncbi:hypothetical protein [Hoeflea marina]|uniref:hypothetical protein n=1 Tax=Hoeflea marina TaxID=274592 RepID=UPI000D716304|nr:hypothetical protein [Hoeflea marina]